MTFIKSSRESEWVSHKPTNRCYRIQSKLVAINYRLARRKDSSRCRRWKLSIPRPSIESLILTSAASNIISHKSWVWAGRDDDEVVRIFFYDTIDNSSIHKPRRVCSVVPSYQLFFIILIYLLVQNKTDDDSHFSLTLHQQQSRAALSLKRYFCWYFNNTKSSLRQTIVTIFFILDSTLFWSWKCYSCTRKLLCAEWERSDCRECRNPPDWLTECGGLSVCTTLTNINYSWRYLTVGLILHFMCSFFRQYHCSVAASPRS